ncbi:hypothetical protein CDAR_312801 [Caerostris darwini]|uniref:Uncharacterized protein n=1 Tax=Caerostris darwini TaxID=1538125 RepID=A0AAV4MQ89_9ARAC|nr:hypothetical protein CDAR_312801 [Caerostris darwini]
MIKGTEGAWGGISPPHNGDFLVGEKIGRQRAGQIIHNAPGRLAPRMITGTEVATRGHISTPQWGFSSGGENWTAVGTPDDYRDRRCYERDISPPHNGDFLLGEKIGRQKAVGTPDDYRDRRCYERDISPPHNGDFLLGEKIGRQKAGQILHNAPGRLS